MFDFFFAAGGTDSIQKVGTGALRFDYATLHTYSATVLQWANSASLDALF